MERVFGICGIIGVLTAFIFISVSILNSPWFSFSSNFISDLGLGEMGLLYSSGLALAGLLCIVFSLGLGRKNYAGYILFVASFFLIGMAFIRSGEIHILFAYMFFMLSVISMIYAGFFERGSKRYIALLLAIVSIGIWVLPTGIGYAVKEIVSAFALEIFVLAFALGMIKK